MTRWDVLTPRPKKDGGVYWHKVGAAFDGEKGITILFDSLPLADNEGRVVCKLFEPREKAKPADTGRPGYASDYDDDTPAF